MNNRPSTTTCRGAIFFLRQWSEAFRFADIDSSSRRNLPTLRHLHTERRELTQENGELFLKSSRLLHESPLLFRPYSHRVRYNSGR